VSPPPVSSADWSYSQPRHLAVLPERPETDELVLVEQRKEATGRTGRARRQRRRSVWACAAQALGNILVTSVSEQEGDGLTGAGLRSHWPRWPVTLAVVGVIIWGGAAAVVIGSSMVAKTRMATQIIAADFGAWPVAIPDSKTLLSDLDARDVTLQDSVIRLDDLDDIDRLEAGGAEVVWAG
jgi:hypothetical protein